MGLGPKSLFNPQIQCDPKVITSWWLPWTDPLWRKASSLGIAFQRADRDGTQSRANKTVEGLEPLLHEECLQVSEMWYYSWEVKNGGVWDTSSTLWAIFTGSGLHCFLRLNQDQCTKAIVMQILKQWKEQLLNKEIWQSTQLPCEAACSPSPVRLR